MSTTGMQLAKLDAANHLKAASDHLSEAWPLVCFTTEAATHIANIRRQIDEIFAKIISDKGVHP